MLANQSSGQRVENALSQGSGVERYGRLWRIGRVDKIDNVVIGKLGFINRPKTSEIWDEEELDFQEVQFKDGSSATFAVNLDNLSLAIQSTPNVGVTSALGAIRALLSLEGEKWTLSPLKRAVSFEQWKNSVDKIVRAKYKLRKPNPHYGEAKSLEEIMEGAEAEVATLEVSSDQGLDLDSSFLQETQLHTERGYGEADFVGIRSDATGQNVETKYSSIAGSEEEAVEIETLENGEVSNNDIAEVSRRAD
ncbi:hypothetical protein HMPREF1287_01162 [Corynebacterium sp. KPL1986]|nr:hypothetical protein HMPREF1293_01991 [Corynebacterium sp. KPL1996]ERS44669.1 hypothetical protein HMPREF1287_01162 [Corynebacterium sp. KPL1986]ERS72594.1 hypothetical protein HMPREF1295_01521 [Corynebacterium sp. KPL1998]ERS73947.1 hypothetical protein HMPREF1300_00930 [Corynebacterium sp. KPL2004]